MQEDAYTGHPFCVVYKVFNCHTSINFTSGWHRAATGHQPHGTLPSVAFVETMSEKLWTGQVPKSLNITLTHVHSFQNIKTYFYTQDSVLDKLGLQTRADKF